MIHAARGGSRVCGKGEHPSRSHRPWQIRGGGGACAWPGPLDPRLHAATYKSVLARLLFVHNTILVGQFFLSNPVEQVNKKTAASFLMVSAWYGQTFFLVIRVDYRYSWILSTWRSWKREFSWILSKSGWSIHFGAAGRGLKGGCRGVKHPFNCEHLVFRWLAV